MYDEQILISINSLVKKAHADAVKHGLLEGYETASPATRVSAAQRIGDEIVEMMRASTEPVHFAEELADVVLCCATFAGFFGINLGFEVEKKRAYNKTRPWKHENEEGNTHE